MPKAVLKPGTIANEAIPMEDSSKRKKSKIRLDSEDESDEEPLIKKPRMTTPALQTVKAPQGTGKAKVKNATLKREDSEDMPLAAALSSPIKKQPSKKSKDKPRPKAVKPDSSSSSEDEKPLVKVTQAKAETSSDSEATAKPKAKRKSKQTSKKPADSSDSEEDKPLKKAKKVKVKKTKVEAVEDDELFKSVATKTKAPKVEAKDTAKIAVKVDGKKAKSEHSDGDEDDDDDESEFRWWEQEKHDGSEKWQTLEHNGVVFPPPYQPLPPDVKMKYNGKQVTLTVEAEEVAGFFGALIETEHAKNETFCSNFFEDFRKVCKDSGMKAADIPTEFGKCDFRPMFEYFEARKEEKKAMGKDEKKRLKEEKDKFEEKYTHALVDGRKEKIGNFRVEPPGLFRGRGAHPKTGKLKTRLMPEQITINIGENVPVPAPPEGHKWAEVRHDKKVTWLATWNENINNNVKYVMMGAGSSFKGQSDLKKYEKARRLKACIHDIRKTYEAELTDKMMEVRQRATALYFIDRFALRAGNEKGEDEADTVGCCSLRLEHISLKLPNIVIFDFLGKDSIRYYNEVAVTPQVFKNLRIFKKSKTDQDMIFDRLNTGKLNKHLTNLMPELSAKVFRTYNASFTFQEQLNKLMDPEATIPDKVLAYNRANREVAVLCNHQRTVSKGHEASMEKIEDKVRELKYQKMRLRRMMVALDKSLAKKKPELLEYESDVDDEWIAEHHTVLYQREQERIRKKFERDNEKLEKEGSDIHPSSELETRLEAAEELKQMYAEEKKTGNVEPKASATVEKLEGQVAKLDERIAVAKTAAIDRDENKTTALGTSKINYIDPRLTFAWCAKYSVPVEKMFTKTLREKFKWAAETPADWEF
ncbi:hypothetical protein BCR37DRAFT_403077 [Protomyces lactucae-debilis]|uniref:DNA topoisomerase I n=1 Tax=Protomyces lactucae-debilis TaxID=2754530 RepID=A0A1Y2F947_PROLT|nr:uncharacterized protein BCR37DRAFT_403077 [Protomyces lactucae-debilis]ORY80419.1 hypothetical protein BCR37DRAFT_403077 [Protomyces lactucae-debilis]